MKDNSRAYHKQKVLHQGNEVQFLGVSQAKVLHLIFTVKEQMNIDGNCLNT
ncbi:hypothetical protein [Virgibacillus ainsalahensis]